MTQENEIKRPTQDLEHEPIKQLDNSEKGGKVSQALETVTIIPKSFAAFANSACLIADAR